MKQIVHTGDLCCESCAKRLAQKLESVRGVRSARANVKKQVVLLETDETASNEEISAFISDMGFEVKSIEERKGLFY